MRLPAQEAPFPQRKRQTKIIWLMPLVGFGGGIVLTFLLDILINYINYHLSLPRDIYEQNLATESYELLWSGFILATYAFFIGITSDKIYITIVPFSILGGQIFGWASYHYKDGLSLPDFLFKSRFSFILIIFSLIMFHLKRYPLEHYSQSEGSDGIR